MSALKSYALKCLVVVHRSTHFSFRIVELLAEDSPVRIRVLAHARCDRPIRVRSELLPRFLAANHKSTKHITTQCHPDNGRIQL